MRLRQFVFVAEQLEPAVEEIGSVLGLEECYRDSGVAEFGLENALFPVGGNFLEIVAPTQSGTAAGRYLERRGGNGGYMVLTHCADAVAHRERILANGIRKVWQHDGPEAYATHFHPADTGGAILSIDSMASSTDYREEMTSWQWAGPDWRNHVKTNKTEAMVGLEFQADDPARLADIWAGLMDRPAQDNRIELDNASLTFTTIEDGRGPGVGGLVLKASDPDAVMAEADSRGLKTGDNRFMLCGVRVTLT